MAERSKSKAREALIGGLVAIALSPVGIVVGYLLNDYLAREKLLIAYVELTPLTDAFTVNDEIRGFFGRSRRFENFKRHMSLRYDSPLVNALEDGQAIRGEDRDAVIHQLSQLVAYCKEGQSALLDLEAHIEAGNDLSSFSPELGRVALGDAAFFLPPLGDDSARAEATTAIMLLRRDSLETMAQAARLKVSLEFYTPRRTGQLEVLVTIVNQGNTDGLVRGNAELQLDTGQIVPLVAFTESFDANRTLPVVMHPVPKRSVSNLFFYLDTARSAPGSHEALTRALDSFAEVPVFVRLRDTRDEPIESDLYTLPGRTPAAARDQ